MRSSTWAEEPTACNWNPGRPRASPSVWCVNSTLPHWVPWTECQSRSSCEREVTEHCWPAPLACSAGLPCSPPSLKNRSLPGLSEQPSLLWLLLGDRGPHRQAALVGLAPGGSSGQPCESFPRQEKCGGRACQRGFPLGSAGVSIS